MKGIQLGKVFIEYPLALGPMAGVTDLPFRLLCREQGAGLVYTEMVSAKAILYRNKNTEELMRIHPAERPAALQLFGSEPESVAEAAARIEDKPFDILDFNMGCPVPKVVNNGEGSALMKNPELAAEIIRAVVRKIHKPVSVKIRRGFDLEHCNAVEVAKRLEDAGSLSDCRSWQDKIPVLLRTGGLGLHPQGKRSGLDPRPRKRRCGFTGLPRKECWRKPGRTE
jgi:tRNA-dihydrouridine synthase